MGLDGVLVLKPINFGSEFFDVGIRNSRRRDGIPPPCHPLAYLIHVVGHWRHIAIQEGGREERCPTRPCVLRSSCRSHSSCQCSRSSCSRSNRTLRLGHQVVSTATSSTNRRGRERKGGDGNGIVKRTPRTSSRFGPPRLARSLSCLKSPAESLRIRSSAPTRSVGSLLPMSCIFGSQVDSEILRCNSRKALRVNTIVDNRSQKIGGVTFGYPP